MNTPHFNEIVSNRIRQIELVLAKKASEYARGDRLSNFKRAAVTMRVSPPRALLGMMMKHWISVLDLIDDLDTGMPAHPVELWQEKIGDAINYLILLEALVMERGEECGSICIEEVLHKGKKK